MQAVISDFFTGFAQTFATLFCFLPVVVILVFISWVIFGKKG